MQQADQAALPSTRRKDLQTVFIGSTDVSRPDDAAGQMSPDPGHVRKLIAD
jgi:hypothetical protein